MELELAPAARKSDSVLPERYEPLRRLGRGSSGTVLLARDHRLERLVAIKLLDALQPSALERFEREALLAARLRSRSIVQIHELDRWHGRPYIVMEYVDGGNLADRELDPAQIAAVASEVACALAAAHAQGIVHRDIKPENVLLDRAGHAYLTDFGLACDAASVLGGGAGASGAISGTPWFMSPEQARGERADARSDVFSLGATLYARLAGRPPFAGATVVDVLYALLHEPPPRLGELAPRTPRDLARLVMRCLEKDPAKRFGSMLELARELDRCADARATPAEGRASWSERLVRFARPWRRAHRISADSSALLDPATIDRVLYGTSSHVHVLDGLEGLDATLAGARVEPFPQTIFQILEHMRFWQDNALARIRGDPVERVEHASDGWLAPPRPENDAQWQASLDGFRNGLRALEQHLPDALARDGSEERRIKRTADNLRMVTGHNSYHLGQIVTLRRQLGLWPAPKGGDTW